MLLEIPTEFLECSCDTLNTRTYDQLLALADTHVGGGRNEIAESYYV